MSDVAVPTQPRRLALRVEGAAVSRSVDPHGRRRSSITAAADSGAPAAAGSTGCRRRQPFDRIAGTDDWVLRIDAAAQLAHRVQVRSRCEMAASSGSLDPAQSAAGGGSVRRQLGRAGLWLRASGLDAARTSTRAPVTIDELEVATPLPRRPARARCVCTCPARFRRSAAIRCWSCTTARTTCAYASLQVVLDNLIHRLEIPPLIVALTDSPERLRRVRRDTRVMRRFVAARDRRQLLERALSSCATMRGRARPDGRELRRGRLVARRVASSGPRSAGCCSSPARSPSPTSAIIVARPCSTRSRASSTSSARRRPTGGTDLHQLRHLRIADLREPQPRTAAERARPRASATRKCATGTTGRTGATGCRLALTWLFPGAAMDGL